MKPATRVARRQMEELREIEAAIYAAAEQDNEDEVERLQALYQKKQRGALNNIR